MIARTARQITHNIEIQHELSSFVTMAFHEDGATANQIGSIWKDQNHWKKLCPSLTVPEKEKDPVHVHVDDDLSSSSKKPPPRDGNPIRTRLVQDGYALVDSPILDEKHNEKRYMELIERVRDGIAKLHQHGYPATFCLLYNETWELARLSHAALSGSTHPNNLFNFDVLAWYVDPAEGNAGFSPHRDRQPQDAATSFYDDHQAKYVTMWLALTDATPENSCLYVIPKQYDPGYLGGDDDGEEGQNASSKDPLQRALPTKESFQHIRAVPRRAGQSVLFTHRILHWGSRGNAHSDVHARIAISFVCSSPSMERPYVSSIHFDQHTIPPFYIRLLLVCAQLLIYHERFNLPKECIRACYEVCKEHGDELDNAYRQKVMIEFVKAMKEAAAADQPASSSLALQEEGGLKNKSQLVIQDDNEEDSEDEAVLEEMLEAEEGGYGEFEDDFDGLGDTIAPQNESLEESNESGDSESDEPPFLFGKRGQAQSGEQVKKSKRQ